MKKTLSILFASLIVYACAKVPLTGRSQLALVKTLALQRLFSYNLWEWEVSWEC